MSCARGNCHDLIVLATKDSVLDNWGFPSLQFGQEADRSCMKPLLTDRALPEQLPRWGILVLESHHSSKFIMEWRTHSFIKIVYVLSGNGTFLFNKKRCSFSEGDVISIPPGTRNRIVDGPNAASSLYVCCVARSVLRFDPSLILQLPCGGLRLQQHFRFYYSIWVGVYD
jgi:mannose-6-phosphate isomerase-like protein (cupin superfamily)